MEDLNSKNRLSVNCILITYNTRKPAKRQHIIIIIQIIQIPFWRANLRAICISQYILLYK